MKFYLFFLLSLVLTTANFRAQTNDGQARRCATGVPSKEWNDWFNERVEAFKVSQQGTRAASATYVIPVIVHVIHSGQKVGNYPNATAAQINSQFQILNDDYAGTGLNVGNAPAPFKNLVANASVRFCPAMYDPNGNLLVEPGIDRVDYTQYTTESPTTPNNQGDFMTYMDTKIKPVTIWDPTRYLNIWVSDVNANALLLGYATFPPASTLPGLGSNVGTASDDGVWISIHAFGNTGFVSYPYNQGRTATHEIGHYLGLRHVWGDGSNCSNNTDYCNDTPPQLASHFGCPSYPQVSCSNAAAGGDMFMNFMDYSDDACLYMFTPDQTTRIHSAMINSPYRKDLTASSATMCDIAFESPVSSFFVSNSGCMDSVLMVNNQSTGVPGLTYTWTSDPAGVVTFSPSQFVANPEIIISGTGTYTLYLDVANTAGDSNSSTNIVVTDCGPNGIRNIPSTISNFQIMPNPNNGSFSIQLTLRTAGAPVVLQVTDGLGRHIREQAMAEAVSGIYDVNLEGIENGVYTVSMISGSQKVSRKLVIAH